MHGLVAYLFAKTFVSLWSVAVGVWSFVVRVWWCFLLSLFLVLCLSLCFTFFFDVHKSPSSYCTHFARCFWRKETFKFFVVVTRLFLAFCVCPNICDLAKQRRKKRF